MTTQKQVAEAIENLEATGVLSPLVAEFAAEFFSDLQADVDIKLLICSLQGLAQGTYLTFDEYSKRHAFKHGC